MNKIRVFLSIAIAVATFSMAGCVNIKGPEKVEVKSNDGQSSTKQIPYGGSKKEWKKFGKSFDNEG